MYITRALAEHELVPFGSTSELKLIIYQLVDPNVSSASTADTCARVDPEKFRCIYVKFFVMELPQRRIEIYFT